MFLSKVKQFCLNNKKIFFYIGIFLALYVFSSEIGFAVEQTPEQIANAKWQEKLSFVNLLFSLTSVFIGLFTQLVSLFLNPGWINGTILGLNEHIKIIWIMVSNIVYLIFAFILIWIAFMNIIGKSGDKWELKQALPKFIIGVLIVPFSWFFVQFVLSISAILTVQVISLPFDTFPEVMNQNNLLTTPIIPNNCTINLSDKSLVQGTETLTEENIARIVSDTYACDEGDLLSIDDVIKNPDSIFGIISIYTYGILNVDKLDTLNVSEISSWINLISQLAVKGIIDILFVLIMCILLVSLGLALFTRGVWLWIYAMFSPVFGLLYFFDKNEGGGDGPTKNFNVKEFINLALVPVYVAAALSFGLLFIFVASQGLTTKKSDDQKAYISDNGINITLGDLKYTINGTILNGGKEEIGKVLTALQGGVGSLIISIFSLIVLWMAVMAALKSSQITSTVVEPVASFGKSIGDLAMKSPQYAPVFGGFSAQGMQKMGRMPQNALEQRVSNKVSPFQQKVNSAFGVSTISEGEKSELREVWRDGIQGDSELGKIQAKLRSMIDKHGTQTKGVQDMIAEYNNALLKSEHHKEFGDKDGLIDKSGKLNEKGVKSLFDTNTDTGKGSRAYNQGYAEKSYVKGSNTKIVEEGTKGYVDGEKLKKLKNPNTKEGDKMIIRKDEKTNDEIKVDIKKVAGLKIAYTEIGDSEGKRDLLLENGTGMEFSKESAPAFDDKNLIDIDNSLEPNDKKQLLNILSNISPNNQVKLLNHIFNQIDKKIDLDDVKKFTGDK